jgi:outer membrane receptor protein involved in Fe transport
VRAPVAADAFNRNDKRLHLVPSERYQFTGLVNYDIAPRHNMFAEVSWTNTISDADLEPIPLASEDIFGDFTEQEAAVFGVPAGILPNNPYIPRALLDLLGTRFGIVNPQLLARPALVAQLMATPGAVIGFQRRMTEIGNRGNDFESSNSRFAVGMEGLIGTWDYEASLSYGRTVQNQISEGGGVNQANMRESLNVVDLNTDGDSNPFTNPQDVVCANPLAAAEGCVPVNLFIPVRTPGTWTQAQVAWLAAPVYRTLQQEQLVVGVSATGTLMENWAGTIDAAVGAEYRREEGADLPDALTRTGQNTGNVTPVTGGAFDVWEAFGELEVPVLRDLPLVEELNVHGSARFSEYSTFGYTMAWSADAEWIPTPGIRFRGQMARAVRAPNIGELFTGASENFAIVTDPCNNLRTPVPLAGGPTDPVVIANCLAIPAIAARATTPGGFVLTQPELQGTGGFNQGNPNLQPEKSDSQQFGIVITPDFWGDWFGNLTVSLDYFDVDISDAIAAVGRNTTLDLCFQTPGAIGPGGVSAGVSPFCNQTPGGPVGWVRDLNGALIEVNIAAGNVNALETDGYELQASYNLDIADLFGSSEQDELGRLSLSGVWQHNNTLDQTVLAGTSLATLRPFVGSVGVFDDEVSLSAVYSFGDLTLAWSGQWMSEATGVDDPGDLAPEAIPAQWFHDVSGTYDIMDNISIFGGVRNVANNYVFIGPQAFNAIPTGWSTEPDTYDGLGRRYFFGVRVKM